MAINAPMTAGTRMTIPARTPTQRGARAKDGAASSDVVFAAQADSASSRLSIQKVSRSGGPIRFTRHGALGGLLSAPSLPAVKLRLRHFLFGLCSALLAWPAPQAAAQAPNGAWVYPSATGNLLYQLDERGQRMRIFRIAAIVAARSRCPM